MCWLRSHKFLELNFIRSCVAKDSSTIQNRNAMTSLAFSSQCCSEVRFLIVAAAATNSVSNTKVENLWNSSFSWKLLLTALCCHKIYWLGQLKRFIPGIALKSITPKFSSDSFHKIGSIHKFSVLNFFVLDWIVDATCSQVEIPIPLF